jgi:hypothetical protein
MHFGAGEPLIERAGGRFDALRFRRSVNGGGFLRAIALSRRDLLILLSAGMRIPLPCDAVVIAKEEVE